MQVQVFEQAAARLTATCDAAALVLADIAEIRAEDLQQYRMALDAFDWTHEQSDDYSVYRRGRDALADLRDMQAEVDPDGAIWRAHPGAKLFGAPGPRGTV